ncbi:xylosyltransferase oxt isoform X3 [Cotesia glomerata]|uniref:xylosyltransferase oxt isoform X3 n=1 Tax=Cotesia glomerata TaxID=32391 RepID=UPI001D025A36|nr:xylosyltransferase oxt isoform X3 [Cotesia glomerata]
MVRSPKMAARGLLEGRSSNCLRKYRIFFIIVGTIMCVQIYLAYSFFKLQNQDHTSVRSFDEVNSAKIDRSDGLPQQYKQLKLPPDKHVINDRESLSFVPSCDVIGREAISAVTRARSQTCKEIIVNVSCLSQQGELYPDRLFSSCPHSLGFIRTPKNLGCFKDDKILRILSDYYIALKTNNSPENCAFLCLQSGYPYAGTEYSTECFCGVDEPSFMKRLPDSSCNLKCSGDPKQSCGGYLAMNVYRTGIQKFKVQEARNSSIKTGIEKPARIAFLLTVNGRASRQVKRLIKILYDPSHFYYIHVDARQDYMYREMLKVEKVCRNKNIKVARGLNLRHASIWGGASLLTTLLTSAQQMLQHSPHWDFLVNLSESDFPIKSNRQLVDFLTWNRGYNFVKSHGREVQRFISKQGLDKTFVECEARMWRLGDRKLPKGIQIDGGSDWVALSRDFVEYVARPKPDDLVAGLLKVFQYTLLPAESFFHTVLRNSKFCDTYVDNNLHVTNWKRKLGCKCQYKAIVDWCGCSPNDFKYDDFNRIRNTEDRNLYFARKFEPVIDQRIIDKVEQWLYPEKYNDSKSKKGYDMYWQNLYHQADLSPTCDDTLLTISNSLARLTYAKFSINYTNIRLLETTAYFKDNKFNAILILAEAVNPITATETANLSINNNYSNMSRSHSGISSNNINIHNNYYSNSNNNFPERIEALVTLKRNYTVNKAWTGRINWLSVNTDYDQKEQTFRNFVGGIGPVSNPILAYEFDLSLVTPRNLTALWINPSGTLVDVSYLQIEESSLIGSVKSQLDEPLAIGKWNVLLVTDTVLAAQLTFFVTPLEFWKNRKITLKKAREIHNGFVNSNNSNKSDQRLPRETNRKWLDIIKNAGLLYNSNKNDENNNNYHLKNNEIDERIGLDLNKWIDELVTQYYSINDFCIINKGQLRNKINSSGNNNNNYYINNLKQCYQTNWSSVSPDSKADLYNLCEK